MSKIDCIKLIAVVISSAVFLVSCGTDKARQGKQGVSSGDSVFSGIFKTDRESARVTVSGDKFMVGGKEIFFSGMNAPWQNWNDFNGGMDEDFWEAEFKRFS